MSHTNRTWIFAAGALLVIGELALLSTRAGGCPVGPAREQPPALRLEMLLLHDARLLLQGDAPAPAAGWKIRNTGD